MTGWAPGVQRLRGPHTLGSSAEAAAWDRARALPRAYEVPPLPRRLSDAERDRVKAAHEWANRTSVAERIPLERARAAASILFAVEIG